jgi:beta-carotene 3-hydroxylase
MSIISIIEIVIVAYVFMEFVAWSAHKFLMHGALWNLHKDHHTKNPNQKHEKNDWFFLMFATPSFLLMYFGYNLNEINSLFWIGIGIALYGMTYVFVHDIYIHQRIKIFNNTKSSYFLAMRRAHKIHHKHLGKEDGEAFGFLWVPQRFRKKMD